MLKKVFISILLSTIAVAVGAQITSSTVAFKEVVPYESLPADSIFYYTANSTMLLSTTAAITSEITWSEYNTTTNTWSVISSTTGTSSEIIVTKEACYQVELVTNGGGRRSKFRVWTLIPDLSGTPVATVVGHTCENINVSTTGITIKPLTIEDPKTQLTYNINYNTTYEWLFNDKSTGNIESTANAFITPPYSDGSYSVKVACKFSFLPVLGPSQQVPVVAKAVKAGFTFTKDKLENKNEGHTDTKGSAPLKVDFEAKPKEPESLSKISEGPITGYTFKFGDAGKVYDSIASYVFLNAGTYEVTLVVENENQNCFDESEPVIFQITDLYLAAPNFFTPTGDGVHDEFKVSYRSVKEFKMVITSRWGKIVYSSSDPTEGWNGNINGKHAAPGVYYYNAYAKGFNNGEEKEITGFLHLIRTEK